MPNEIGNRIKEAREYIGLTQQQLAEALKIPRSAISDIETGKRKITADELKTLAQILRHPINYLMGENTDSAPEITALARAASVLNQNDRKELLRFAKYLEFQSMSKKEKKK